MVALQSEIFDRNKTTYKSKIKPTVSGKIIKHIPERNIPVQTITMYFTSQDGCCSWSTPSRRLVTNTGHLSFCACAVAGILERCHEGTEFKPLYHVHLFDFLGVNVRLNNEKFFESFLKAFVTDFGLKVHISNVSHSSRQ